MRLLPFAIGLAAFSTATPAMAQQEDLQAWEQLNVVLPVAKGVRITGEQIARTSDRQEGIYTTEYGILAGIHIAEGVELGIGYRHVGFFNANTGADEERLRQQLVFSRGRLAGRLRLDERFNPRGREIGFRLRPLIRSNIPVGRRRLSLFVSHESFILPNTTAWGQRAGYERMRNIAGVTVPIGTAVSADVGYLNQYRLGRGGARPQMDHAVTLQLTVNLDKLGVTLLHD